MKLLSIEGLQRWFACHILADFLQRTGSEITTRKLIVSHQSSHQSEVPNLKQCSTCEASDTRSEDRFLRETNCKNRKLALVGIILIKFSSLSSDPAVSSSIFVGAEREENLKL